LDRSEHMLALISEDYFDRLWCVFELASYVHRQGEDRLIILPLHLATRVISLAVLLPSIIVPMLLATAFAPSLMSNFSTVPILMGIPTRGR